METRNNIEPEQLPQQTTFSFDYYHNNGKAYKIKFNSVFDSGNMQLVHSPSNSSYIVYTAPDCCGTKYEGWSKSWYHFSVQGVPKGAYFNFTIRKIAILYAMYKNAPEAYKPVCRVGNNGWKRIEETAIIAKNAEDGALDVKFSYMFDSDEEQDVFFAFSYPFSYEENKTMLDNYDSIYGKDSEIFYSRELFTRSVQERDVDLLTISSHEGKLTELESDLDENLFPNKAIKPRPKRFRNNKPVVLITARVHPGETPASHTMNGILKFLLDKKDVRAQLLRQYFVFMFVPMINPDGVYNGHYRMDTYYQNLNRYYKNPDPKKQPAIFAIKELVQYLHSDSRLFFYCDLHAHAAKKGCFLYGNALDFIMQVETMLFAKVMAMNCVNFEYESCNFSKKHMNARDKGEKLTKEGAGRVAIHKICNLVHSYTMECGLHFSNELNNIAAPATTKNCFEDNISDLNSSYYKDSPTYYSIEIYQNLGKGMLVSILDIFQKNPATRMNTSSGVTIDNLRKEVACKVVKFHRFWKEAHVKRKCLKINELIKELFYDDFDKKNVFTIIINEAKLAASVSNSTIRKIQNMSAMMTASLPPRGNIKKLTAEIYSKEREKERERQSFATSEANVVADENVENTEHGMILVRTLPKLQNTPIAMRDYRLKQNDARALQVEVKQVREEQLPTGCYDNKLVWQSHLRLPDKGLMVYVSGGSEPNSLRDVSSPTRNHAIKERKTNMQNHSQQPSFDNMSLTGVKKTSYIKKSNLSNVKLPELDTGTATTVTESYNQWANNSNNGVINAYGSRNYMITKSKGKIAVGNLVRKVKGTSAMER